MVTPQTTALRNTPHPRHVTRMTHIGKTLRNVR